VSLPCQYRSLRYIHGEESGHGTICYYTLHSAVGDVTDCVCSTEASMSLQKSLSGEVKPSSLLA
jgi:hypothetical protein